MKAAGVVLAIVAALALQTTLAPLLIGGTGLIDLVLVVVVFVALLWGPSGGLLLGAAAGLAQDALASGVIGIGGLAKTVVGFLVGILSRQLILAQPLPRFVVFFGATFLHAAIFVGLYVLLDLRTFPSPWAGVAGQAVANAVVGVLALQISGMVPGLLERRRAQRARIRR